MLIGLTGAAGVGKDTAAMHLARQHNFIQVALATPLRNMLIAGFGLSESDFMPGTKNAMIDWIGRSPRQLLQTLGTEWGRSHVHSEIWNRVAARELDRLRDMHVVVSDVRFENEADMIRRRGGVIVRIQRPDVAPVNPHMSERGIEPRVDEFEVWNTGRPEDMFDELDAIIGDLAFCDLEQLQVERPA